MVYVVAVAVGADEVLTKLLNTPLLQTFVPSAYRDLVRFVDDVLRGTSRILCSCAILHRDVGVFQFAIAAMPQLRQSLVIGLSI